MKVTIDGVEYESVDTQITEGKDVTCVDCDIFKARPPKSPIDFPLCYEIGNRKAHQSCSRLAYRGIKRTFKKAKK